LELSSCLNIFDIQQDIAQKWFFVGNRARELLVLRVNKLQAAPLSGFWATSFEWEAYQRHLKQGQRCLPVFDL